VGRGVGGGVRGGAEGGRDRGCAIFHCRYHGPGFFLRWTTISSFVVPFFPKVGTTLMLGI